MKVFISIPPDYLARAKYTISELALRFATPINYTSVRGEAHLIYEQKNDIPAKAVIIPFEPSIYLPETICGLLKDHQNHCIWTNSKNFSKVDLIGSTYRLLAYLDEQQINEKERNKRGIFYSNALPESRRLSGAIPFVENHAAILFKKITKIFPSIISEKIEKYPGGKKYALSLSHDVDALYLNSIPELAVNLLKFLTRRKTEYFKLFLTGLKYIGKNEQNPFFTFANWQKWEAKRKIKSIFYLYFRPKHIKFDINDCKSGVNEKTDWKLLRDLADQGWEFGLHASINTRLNAEGFKVSKAWLENKLGHKIHGIRHHYWALDWLEPYKTHQQHADAGFLFDSSIAWRDLAGFRAGTSLPYFPFDPAEEKKIDLLEIPCNFMDGHIIDSGISNPEEQLKIASEKGNEIISTIKAVEGVIVPNWHAETFSKAEKLVYLELLTRLLSPILNDTDSWIATPSEIAQHWNIYKKKILPVN